jgi:hypothetical protein
MLKVKILISKNSNVANFSGVSSNSIWQLQIVLTLAEHSSPTILNKFLVDKGLVLERFLVDQ